MHENEPVHSERNRLELVPQTLANIGLPDKFLDSLCKRFDLHPSESEKWRVSEVARSRKGAFESRIDERRTVSPIVPPPVTLKRLDMVRMALECGAPQIQLPVPGSRV